MRVCLIYDCLYPWTVGGAERWYRTLAERLVAAGHDVTYLTLRQWPRGQKPELHGVRIVEAGPRMALYAGPGRRRTLPPIVFGLGVFWHLLRHGRRYDVVHSASFPYFSLLAAGLVRPLGRYRLFVDWFEVWTAAYWRSYLGRAGGAVGHAVQRLCARVPQRAFCFSRLHAARLREEGLRGEPEVLEGAYTGTLEPRKPVPVEPVVVAAARHIPEKQLPALPPAIALARREAPELTGLILGDGPDRAAVQRAIAGAGLDGVVDAPGFVTPEEVDSALGRAMCMVLPSRREGYGMVVVEAASHGTPSVVVAAEDNAAVELISEGENGVVAPSASPEDLAAAILRVRAGGQEMRRSTLQWFVANGPRLSLASSLERVVAAYEASARS